MEFNLCFSLLLLSETLVEKFRPDMRMLTLPNYALYEVHSNHEERKLNGDEKPLLVQLNWHIDDREGRFLLKNIDQKTHVSKNRHYRLFKVRLNLLLFAFFAVFGW